MANEKRLIEIPSDGIVKIQIMRGYDTVGERRIDLRSFPTVDAVEVVRCKDCKCGKHPESTLMVGKYVNCALYDPMPMMRCNDFCSYGERKDNASI